MFNPKGEVAALPGAYAEGGGGTFINEGRDAVHTMDTHTVFGAKPEHVELSGDKFFWDADKVQGGDKVLPGAYAEGGKHNLILEPEAPRNQDTGGVVDSGVVFGSKPEHVELGGDKFFWDAKNASGTGGELPTAYAEGEQPNDRNKVRVQTGQVTETRLNSKLCSPQNDGMNRTLRVHIVTALCLMLRS